MKTKHPRHGTQAGFTILEGLVSILIFSIGVLALVGLQTTSIQQASNAKYRSDASLLANQLIGRMWVGDRTAATLQTNFATGGASYNAWLADVQATLPGATVSAPTVAVTANGTAADGTVTVNIFWKAPNEAASLAAHQYTAIAQIK